MTAATFHADVEAPRHGWRSLLWIAPLTALWIGLGRERMLDPILRR